MEETLYDKLLQAVHKNVDTNGTGQDEIDCAKACERVAIQAQIQTIKNIFKKYNNNLRTTLFEGGFVQSLDSIALEEIKELEKQLL